MRTRPGQLLVVPESKAAHPLTAFLNNRHRPEVIALDVTEVVGSIDLYRISCPWTPTGDPIGTVVLILAVTR